MAWSIANRCRPAEAWRGAAAAMFGVGWGANQFASLILAYEAHRGLSVSTSEALFGVYALGLIPALLVGGPISDRHGRKVMGRPAALCSVVATLVLMAGHDHTTLLYVGRFLAGACSGAMFAAGTAWVKELSVAPFGTGTGPLGARRTAVALSAGFGLGPVVAGIIAQWGPAPLVLPYVAHLMVMAWVLPYMWRVPETTGMTTMPAPVPWTHCLRVAAPIRRRFLTVVVPLGPWVFTAPAVGFAVLPGLVAGHTPGYGVAFSALTAGVVIAFGVLIQPLAHRLGRRGMLVGVVAIVVGLILGALAASTGSWPLVLVADSSLGCGYGLCLVAGLIEVQHLAGPDDLAGLTAIFYSLTYVGFAVPVALAALHRLTSSASLLTGLAALATLTLLLLAATTRQAGLELAGSPRPTEASTRAPQHDATPGPS
ncbi:MAG: MFS transporter [Actinomycetota bacterium]|nr:MFS transporter [Actinomycetota bacterium]